MRLNPGHITSCKQLKSVGWWSSFERIIANNGKQNFSHRYLMRFETKPQSKLVSVYQEATSHRLVGAWWRTGSNNNQQISGTTPHPAAYRFLYFLMRFEAFLSVILVVGFENSIGSRARYLWEQNELTRGLQSNIAI